MITTVMTLAAVVSSFNGYQEDVVQFCCSISDGQTQGIQYPSRLIEHLNQRMHNVISPQGWKQCSQGYSGRLRFWRYCNSWGGGAGYCIISVFEVAFFKGYLNFNCKCVTYEDEDSRSSVWF